MSAEKKTKWVKNKWNCHVEIYQGAYTPPGDKDVYVACLYGFNPQNEKYPYIAIDVTKEQAEQIIEELQARLKKVNRRVSNRRLPYYDRRQG